jgi:hypothetical protein
MLEKLQQCHASNRNIRLGMAAEGQQSTLVTSIVGMQTTFSAGTIIDTELNRKAAMPNADFAKWPKPEDIARVILFMCVKDAKVIRGAAIPVYGDSV